MVRRAAGRIDMLGFENVNEVLDGFDRGEYGPAFASMGSVEEVRAERES